MGAVHGFIQAFNDDDVDRIQAACADETSIVDDFPPYEWNGSRATTRWHDDMAVVAAEYGMSDWSVAVDEPRHVVVTDRIAYVVVPIAARWSENGTPADRTGHLTAALRELSEGWRISAFTWTWD
jgi:hypothetical protein